MSVNSENASLVLFTRDAVASDQKATHTWNNIDLQSLLEGMYDKYDSFNLCLSFAMTMINGVNSFGAPTTANDRNLLIYVSGLPFKAQCYNSGANRISNSTVMGYLQLPSDTSTSTTSPSFQSFYIAQFSKYSPITNITIQLRRMDNTLPTLNNDLPQMVFCFDIYGVEPKTKLIDNRIKKI